MTLLNRHRHLFALAVLTIVFTQSCMSAGSSTFQRDAGACEPRPELVGTWVSKRASQLGSRSMTLRLECDCRYTMRVGLPVGRVTEQGQYRVDDRAIVLSRSSTETSWPYELTGGELRLTESVDEVHAYSRTQVNRCAQ